MTTEHDTQMPPRLWLTHDWAVGARPTISRGPEAVEYVRADCTDIPQLYALANIRAAIGDPHGRLTLDQVCERVEDYAARAAEGRACDWHLKYSNRRRSAAIAAMEYASAPLTDEPDSFLRCWLLGEFDVIRKEWPDAPAAVFQGAEITGGDA
ncbi:hypothetical protein FAZ79_00300 [Guyparkeria sp. SB14A]|uniref:hypothetical protein n=1 Tax=Guyparkeria sp. SB14A TaxID=2571147 RepID=UPI0010AC192C|nr:hypothetical protein [Guyparkeria sp. SB14A]TKA91780.1 hypothetical protein FAZ79_00300 [Guyparkeria sp. SB14A]